MDHVQHMAGVDCVPWTPSRSRVVVFAPSAHVLGGVAQWLVDLGRALGEVGVEVLAGLPDGLHHDYDEYLRHYASLKAVRLTNRTGTHEGRIRAMLRVLENTRPDMVLGVYMPDTFPAVNRYRARGKRVVQVAMAAHGLSAGLLADAAAWRQSLDGVISVNRLLQSLMIQEAGIEASRSLYAPCGVAVPDRVHHVPDPECLRIAWAGRLENGEKRVLDLPRLLACLDQSGKQYQLMIAGGGPDELLLRQALQAWEHVGKVLWLGIVRRDDMAARFWAKSDVLLVTSERETGPLVAWEAMAHGIPVVSSRYLGHACEGALRHLDTCLLYPVGNVQDAATCLNAMRDLSLRARLSASGRELVRARYSWTVFRQAWASALAAIMAREPLPWTEKGVPVVAQQGRLDRWIGVPAAETVRELLRRRFRHASAGGEWPHELAGLCDNATFTQAAATLEAKAGRA